jgi:hypothetical protein
LNLPQYRKEGEHAGKKQAQAEIDNLHYGAPGIRLQERRHSGLQMVLRRAYKRLRKTKGAARIGNR